MVLIHSTNVSKTKILLFKKIIHMYLERDRFKYNIKYKIKYMLFPHFFPIVGVGWGMCAVI